MKPTMIFALAMLTLIVMMSSFDIHLGNVVPAITVPENMQANVLYICPAVSDGWDSASSILKSIKTPIWIGFFFALTMLLFSWGWVLYQSLLKDKFERNPFVKPWGFTKLLFWAFIIILLAMNTPNHYRTVHIRGVSGDYVLCENNTPNRWPNVPPLTKNGTWPQPVKYSFVTD